MRASRPRYRASEPRPHDRVDRRLMGCPRQQALVELRRAHAIVEPRAGFGEPAGGPDQLRDRAPVRPSRRRQSPRAGGWRGPRGRSPDRRRRARRAPSGRARGTWTSHGSAARRQRLHLVGCVPARVAARRAGARRMPRHSGRRCCASAPRRRRRVAPPRRNGRRSWRAARASAPESRGIGSGARSVAMRSKVSMSRCAACMSPASSRSTARHVRIRQRCDWLRQRSAPRSACDASADALAQIGSARRARGVSSAAR